MTCIKRTILILLPADRLTAAGMHNDTIYFSKIRLP